MNACVFIGPTLPVTQARRLLDAEYLPPVRQGDVYRAVKRFRPRAIGIIDGYFHQVPSVWHKEILWAMAGGVHVFGSSSMGALRAAELHRFGMHGVGEVFAAFRQRLIEDDDEVAVVHGPPESGFLAASEAMVNIRKTLAKAQANRIIGGETRRALEGIAKSLFYPRRSYPELLQRGADHGLSTEELSALRDWLEQGRLDVKREDALKMLAAMGELLKNDAPPKQVDFGFEHTTMWQAAINDIDAAVDNPSADAADSDREWLMDELRLDSDAYPRLKQAALVRMLARREAELGRIEVSEEEIRQSITEFRLTHGLHRGRDLDRWLEERNLDRVSLEKLMEDQVRVSRLAGDNCAELERYLVDQLRMDASHARIAVRAREKQKALETEGKPAKKGQAQNRQQALEELRALRWYFTQHLGRPVPENMDAWAARSGFASRNAFYRAVVREYRFKLRSKKA